MTSDTDTFIVMKWPLVNELINESEFFNNSIRITNPKLIEEYGTHAYLIRKSWIDNLDIIL